MFAKRVQSVIWMDHTGITKDMRRDFQSTYLFDDGFETIEEMKSKLEELGFTTEHFCILHFCDMYYAVNLHSYRDKIVVTKENVYQQTRAFGTTEKTAVEDFTSKPITTAPSFDTKKWQDGIVVDLVMIDPNISVSINGRTFTPFFIEGNNTIIAFGLNFFITEIRIMTDSYVSHVFANYFNDNSLKFIEKDIQRLVNAGYQYYNPFQQTVSKNDAERKKKLKQQIGELTIPKTIMRPWLPNRTKLLREREINPPRIHIEYPRRG